MALRVIQDGRVEIAPDDVCECYHLKLFEGWTMST